MSFSDDLMADAKELGVEAETVFHAVADGVWDSIVNGSGVTGAPGQPVRTGALKQSFGTGPRYVNAQLAFVESSDPKAIFIEIDARGIVFANGGPHSVKLTEMRFQPLIDSVTSRWNSLEIGP